MLAYIYIPYMDIIRWLVVIVNFCIRRFDSFPYNEPLTPKSWDDSSDHIYAWIQWGQNVCSFAKNTSSWQGWACRACHSLWNKDLPICHISPNRWGRVLWNLVSTPWIDSAHQWRCYERIALSGFGSRLRLAFGWPKCQGRQLPAHQALEGWTLWSVQGCSPGRWLVGLVVSNVVGQGCCNLFISVKGGQFTICHMSILPIFIWASYVFSRWWNIDWRGTHIIHA